MASINIILNKYKTNSDGEFGVGLWASANGASGIGVRGIGLGTNGTGIYGHGKLRAAYFDGDVTIKNGNITDCGNIRCADIRADKILAALIEAPVKLFKINHPLDPDERFLSHASIESSEMLNLYTGIVALDESGEAWIQLADWFEALNEKFTYQLTCINGYAPVFIAKTIENNRFRIAGGMAGMEVSWQVTGIRHDTYAVEHPLEVEAYK